MIKNLPAAIATPPSITRLIPMPVFYDNAALSLLAIMLFPDDVVLARKCVAHLLSHGTLQSALGAGIQVDNRYMSAIVTDLADGQPDQKTVGRRRYWASACGQVVKVLFALINSNDERVRDRATWEAAIKIAEREIGRTIRKSGSSLRAHLHRFRPALHLCAAFELARDQQRPPLTAEALMLNSMVIYERLKTWDVTRSYRGPRRSEFLTGDVFWRWQGSGYADHGVPDIGYLFDRMPLHEKGGRPLGS